MTLRKLTLLAFVLQIATTAQATAAEAVRSDHPLATSVTSLNGPWSLAVDPKNVGRAEKWAEKSLAAAKPTTVPGIIQDVFHGYHGVAWYERQFTPPANPHPQGRTLLRFWQVDYLADVWLNGVHVAQHEGGEDPFVCDITEVVKPGAVNRVVVRVLNPTHEPIDGFTLVQTPRRNKSYPPTQGCDYNYGGITDDVDLLIAPAVRIEDLFVRADPNTGRIRIQANVRNASKEAAKGQLRFTVCPATAGETLNVAELARELPPGDTLIESELRIENPRLWDLNDPYMYRVAARVGVDGSASFDEQSTRCGFRDFRFRDGAFRLNGKRVFLKSSHSGEEAPGLRVATNPDWLRKDLLNCKIMNFNMIRFIAGIPRRYQLELCDEIGLMVYEEDFASWCLEDSPKMAERFDRSTAGMIRRDRNHPSVVMWGLLNETSDGAVFRHAVAALPLVRALDDSRVVMLNSGRFDNATNGVDLWSNPGRTDPCVNHNGTNRTIEALGIKWTPGRLVFHPGVNGEYAVVRWTAPQNGPADLTVVFSNASATATTDVHVFHNGRALFNSFINLNNAGPEAKYHDTLNVKPGDTIDCVVGYGNKSYGADSTGLDFIVNLGSQKFDAAREFTLAANPHGPWTYGQLPPGETPKTAAFAKFPHAQGAVGSISNPGSSVWEDILADAHPYQSLPHDAAVIHRLRTVGEGGMPLFLSEYGMGSAVDLVRLLRQYEQWGKTASDDAVYYRQRLGQFMADWRRWNLDDTFAGPEDYFRQCLTWMAPMRKLGINAIRANPRVIGYSLTGTQDQGLSGEGLTTIFRELKPGTLDAMFDAYYPLRWCLFVEPLHVYRGRKARLEAVLANEDVLAAGAYPVRLQVMGPGNAAALDRMVTVNIPDPKSKPQPPFALKVFADDVAIDGPAGKYRFLATLQKGGAAAGGEVEFYVFDPAEMPAVASEVVLWGNDDGLAGWLRANSIKTRPFAPGAQSAREVILVGSRPAAGGAEAFRELARHIARGSNVVFLSLDAFGKDKDPLGWLPLKNKGYRVGLPVWLYHKDDWIKRHPIFDGLPAGCIMDHAIYLEVLPTTGFAGQDVPAEIVAGAIDTSCGYSSGLTVGVFHLGAGRFTLNTLRIGEHLGSNPVADRLLRNMLRDAASHVNQPPAELPADFDQQLKAMGYQ